MGDLVRMFDEPVHPHEIRQRLHALEERCAVLEGEHANHQRIIKLLLQTNELLMKAHNEREKPIPRD